MRCLHAHTHSLMDVVSAALSDICRLHRLLQEMMAERDNKTMVFVETKRRADDLMHRLKRAG